MTIWETLIAFGLAFALAAVVMAFDLLRSKRVVHIWASRALALLAFGALAADHAVGRVRDWWRR
jgi:hypothetical protein